MNPALDPVLLQYRDTLKAEKNASKEEVEEALKKVGGALTRRYKHLEEGKGGGGGGGGEGGRVVDPHHQEYKLETKALMESARVRLGGPPSLPPSLPPCILPLIPPFLPPTLLTPQEYPHFI